MSSSNTGTVRFTLDPANPPRMTDEQMQALRAQRDQDIDLTDIPEQTGAGWRRISDLIPAENKQQITLRLDADVLSFFRSTGRRYQSRINAILRAFYQARCAAPKCPR